MLKVFYQKLFNMFFLSLKLVATSTVGLLISHLIPLPMCPSLCKERFHRNIVSAENEVSISNTNSLFVIFFGNKGNNTNYFGVDL